MKKLVFEFNGKFEWSIPIVEVLAYSTFFLLLFDNQFLILHFDNFYISALGKTLLETAIIKNSSVLLVVAFMCFAVKFVAAFFMLKKSKWGYISIIVLYLIDFIVSLVGLFTCETTLQEWSVKDFVFLIASLVLVPMISCLYVYLYFKLIQHKKKPKEFKIFTSVIFSVLVIAFVFAWVDGNKKIATESEVATLNRCYGYSEKYLYEKLPEDKGKLEKMQSDIEEVFNKELFFTAFNQSAYFDRLKEEQKSDTASAVQMKSSYANELMYLKCKILLKLDKNEEYVDYYIETRRYFSNTQVEFYYKYLEQDIKNFSEDECKIIKIACTEFIKADVNRIEKNWAAIDYSIADGKDLTKKERQKIAKEIRKELLSDYNKEQIKEDLIKAEKYESYKRSLYMLK